MALFLTRKSGKDLIKELEGYSSKAYPDEAGHWTIGYGHKIRPNETYLNITAEKADELLSKDLSAAENVVNSTVKVPLSQNQFDALVSFVYNIGGNAFLNSTLLKKLNLKQYGEVGSEMARWKYITKDGKKVVSNGLVNRRQKEATVFYS